MTFIYELDPYSMEMCRVCENELPASRLSKVIVRQIDRKDRNHIYHAALRVVKNYISRAQSGGEQTND